MFKHHHVVVVGAEGDEVPVDVLEVSTGGVGDAGVPVDSVP